MTPAGWKKRAAAATVELTRRGGRGVLVPGGYVLTAAHCVEWYASGGMALGDYCLEAVKPKVGDTFRMSICAVEPVADIAVLETADNQELSDDAEAFDAFSAATSPVPICSEDFYDRGPVGVHVLAHGEAWIGCQSDRAGDGVRPRRSGMAESGEANPLRDIRWALPNWIWHRIEAGLRACLAPTR